MSHSIKMTIALNSDHELKVCEDVQKTINQFPDEYKNIFGKQINSIGESIVELKEFAAGIDNLFVNVDSVGAQNSLLDYQRKLDGIVKRVNNIKSINLSEYITKVSSDKLEALEEIISNNGVMATLAIQQLDDEGIQLSKESVMERIDVIRNSDISSEELKVEIKKVEDFIFNSGFDESVEDHLLEVCEKTSSPQVLSDLYALVGAMDIEKNRIDQMHIQVTNIFKEMKFDEVDSDNAINNDGELKKTVTYRNSLKKEFKMTYRASGIDYQMGNYDKHLCESDSDIFMETLRKDFKVSDVRIVRNVSNERPMLRQMKINTNERGK